MTISRFFYPVVAIIFVANAQVNLDLSFDTNSSEIVSVPNVAKSFNIGISNRGSEDLDVQLSIKYKAYTSNDGLPAGIYRDKDLANFWIKRQEW